MVHSALFRFRTSNRTEICVFPGDYDGDKALIIWDPNLVVPFVSTPLEYSETPAEARGTFDMSTPSVPEFLASCEGKSEKHRMQLLQRYMLSEIITANCIRNLEPERRFPETERGAGLGSFILERVQDMINAEKKRANEELEERVSSFKSLQGHSHSALDPHLVAPWNDAERRAKVLSERGVHLSRTELDLIVKHVDYCHAKHEDSISGIKFTSRPIKDRQDILRESSLRFKAGPPGPILLRSKEEVTVLQASYAYLSADANKTFPWDVAMRALCDIKARGLGNPRYMQNNVYELMDISPLGGR